MRQVMLAIITSVAIVGVLGSMWLFRGRLGARENTAPQRGFAPCLVADPDDRVAGCTAFIEANAGDRNLAIAYYNRGLAYNQKREYGRAIADQDQAIKLKSDYADAFGERAIAHFHKGYSARAIQDYAEAIRLAPNEFRNFQNRGNLYYRECQWDRAIADYDKAIERSPNVASLVFRGRAYANVGQFDRALADFDEALKLDPNNTETANLRVNTARAGGATFTLFDPPRSTKTEPCCINSAGTITGTYTPASDNAERPRGDKAPEGFVRASDGTFTGFAPPGSKWTYPTGINDAGTVIGDYMTDAFKAVRGFVRESDGTITTVGSQPNTEYWLLGINNAGTIIGYYKEVGAAFGYASHGFVRAAGGTITTFDPPRSIDTVPVSINDAGMITGHFREGDLSHAFARVPSASREGDSSHGFVRDSDGTVTTFDVQGSKHTVPKKISSAGTITGTYWDDPTSKHFFVRLPDGTITTFDAPGFQASLGGINEQGTIAGRYNRTSSPHSGTSFVRTPDGAITTFNVPCSSDTGALSINNTGAIAGYFSSAKDKAVFPQSHGFLRSPGGIASLSP